MGCPARDCSHSTRGKEPNHANLLAPGQAHPCDGEERQCQDDQVHDAVDEDAKEEEMGLVNGAVGAWDGLHILPVGLDGDALENGQERAHDNPYDDRDDEDLDGNADRREFEEAPVEGEKGDFGGGDGRCVGQRADPQHQARVLQLRFSIGIEFLDGRPEAITCRRWSKSDIVMY